ncbi:hypothetical protein ACHAWF_005362 [Thalassiosira exigua]
MPTILPPPESLPPDSDVTTTRERVEIFGKIESGPHHIKVGTNIIFQLDGTFAFEVDEVEENNVSVWWYKNSYNWDRPNATDDFLSQHPNSCLVPLKKGRSFKNPDSVGLIDGGGFYDQFHFQAARAGTVRVVFSGMSPDDVGVTSDMTSFDDFSPSFAEFDLK